MKNLSAPIKNEIGIFFKEGVADFVAFLSKLEEEMISQKLSIEKATQILIERSTAVVRKGDELVKGLKDRVAANKIKQQFRKMVGKWAFQSEIIRRAYEKPKGYPGDYELLEIIYNNKPISQGIGRCYDFHFLSDDLAAAVRNRKDTIVSILEDLILNGHKDLKILNFACGSCRDLKELFQFFGKPLTGIKFTCVDHDEEALKFSRDSLEKYGNEITFINEDVIKFSLRPTLSYQFGNQDIIYSVGLIDYLPSRVLREFLRNSYALLNKNGKLIISHKDQDVYHPTLPDWYCDWSFYYRTEKQVLGIIGEAGILENSISMSRDKSNIMFFTCLAKT